jgi:hypothetical protein
MSKNDFFVKQRQEKPSGGLFYGRKFYKHSLKWSELTASQNAGDLYECLPEKTTLVGEIIYQGLTDEELGALLFALGLGWKKPIYHKLGYAKPAFLGSVRLSVEPLPLPRYETPPQSIDDLESIATQYYDKYKDSISEAVAVLEKEWSEIGQSEWVKQDGKLGY